MFNEVREKYDLIFRSTMLEYSEDDVQALLDIKSKLSNVGKLKFQYSKYNHINIILCCQKVLDRRGNET